MGKGPSVRVNVYLPLKSYDLMKQLGDVLGLPGDAACVRHFTMLGIQAGAGSIAAVSSIEQNKSTLQFLGDFNKNLESGVQEAINNAVAEDRAKRSKKASKS